MCLYFCMQGGGCYQVSRTLTAKFHYSQRTIKHKKIVKYLIIQYIEDFLHRDDLKVNTQCKGSLWKLGNHTMMSCSHRYV